MPPAPAAPPAAPALLATFRAVRRQTDALVEGLTPEDCMLQSMADASPVKWHIAHTTWFFETFVLERAPGGWRPVDPAYRRLFNSYYVGVGERHPRPERGLLSRPSFAEVQSYRRTVEQQVAALLEQRALAPDLLALVELGLHHEQQHQELILTDLKHHFSRNPLLPAYRPLGKRPVGDPPGPLRFVGFEGGRTELGHAGPAFAFDNEQPRHTAWLAPFELASRLVCNAEYLAFIEDGGYRRPELWLSDGWDLCSREGWQAPLYWQRDGENEAAGWRHFTLQGEREPAPGEPVCHLSYYEADAYARWAGARLPTEAEWETAAASLGPPGSGTGSGRGCLLEQGLFHPRPANGDPLAQMFGDTWEWTQSAYLPYPGFRAAPGAVGEYNGKFMINQMVLRGGSCATPASHLRASYRNFFPPQARWQFSGLRLARDAG
ncbi:ergothioneine biosynthesis protein EgtB [Aquabacterium sp. A7-Y]|nr:ergothioneine biosynthesis protein EgtB [Aquabacterium sp. A7-Y]MCW7539810.1 ergothioneine biosynthesis protein EgtB [Aquabacterium sp. A7-Y]